MHKITIRFMLYAQRPNPRQSKWAAYFHPPPVIVMKQKRQELEQESSTIVN